MVNLSLYNNKWYNPGGNSIKRLCWYFINILFFRNPFFPIYSTKVILLRLFGAKVGRNVIIKPCVNIKYPWNLIIGNYVWIGEKVWIDNLAKVTICDNVCISQGAMLLCGNHNYKKETFDLMIGEIMLEDGVWIGAKSVVCPGITMRSQSILTVGSVISQDSEERGIYRGNPAIKIKNRQYEKLSLK